MSPLRVVLLAAVLVGAAVPATLTFASADDPPTASSFPPIPWSQQGFDASLLPGETGWFLVPVSVDQPAYVRFATDIYAGGSSARTAWAALLLLETNPMPPVFGAGHSQTSSLASISHEGKTSWCCEGMWTSYSYTWGDGPEAVVPMQPGQVAWFGLAATGWSDWDAAYFEVSGQTLVTIGDARTGERVEAVDLYEEALRQGTHAKLLGSDLVALPADAERTWTSEHYGVFLADAYAWSDHGATVTVEIPGEARREVAIDWEQGLFAGAHRAGTYRIALSDVEAPSLANGGAPMQVRAFFADIDVPGDVAYVWPEA